MKIEFSRFIDALFAGILIIIILVMGWLDDIELKAQDRFYQRPGVKSDDIIVIGVDKVTVSNLGPLSPEYRKYITSAITYLNNHDPNARPAVIGIDSFFTGSYDAEVDSKLAAAAGQYGNVVVAAEVDPDDENESDEDIWSKSWPYIPPYEALAEVVDVGHIHAPNENVAHHDLLFVNTEERGRLYSLSRVVYEKYCKFKGIEANATPET